MLYSNQTSPNVFSNIFTTGDPDVYKIDVVSQVEGVAPVAIKTVPVAFCVAPILVVIAKLCYVMLLANVLEIQNELFTIKKISETYEKYSYFARSSSRSTYSIIIY